MDTNNQAVEALAAETIFNAKLAQAREIQDRIEELLKEQDRILAPLVKQVIKADDPNATMRLVRQLPGGFHRTELRTHHINRMQDYEYKRKFKAGST